MMLDPVILVLLDLWQGSERDLDMCDIYWLNSKLERGIYSHYFQVLIKNYIWDLHEKVCFNKKIK